MVRMRTKKKSRPGRGETLAKDAAVAVPADCSLSARERDTAAAEETEGLRARIIGAAFKLLMERGYDGTNTLEIATRAKVSKRALYELFGNKRGILLQMVAMTAARMQLPLRLPRPRDEAALRATLVSFGEGLLREASSPVVLSVYRLAASEAERSTEVAEALDSAGRNANRAALAELLRRAQEDGLLGAGEAEAIAGQFFSLLWGDLLLRQVLRLAKPPSAAEGHARATAATDAVLSLHPPARARR
jgi:AcrR family transcriptional regulator